MYAPVYVGDGKESAMDLPKILSEHDPDSVLPVLYTGEYAGFTNCMEHYVQVQPYFEGNFLKVSKKDEVRDVLAFKHPDVQITAHHERFEVL